MLAVSVYNANSYFLATAKIGAVHSVVYGGFSVDALQGRIEDSESKVVVTADGGFMNGKVVELKKTVDEAVRRCPPSRP